MIKSSMKTKTMIKMRNSKKKMDLTCKDQNFLHKSPHLVDREIQSWIEYYGWQDHLGTTLQIKSN